VPAVTASPIPALTSGLDAPVALSPDQCPSLLAHLTQLADPRARRHPLVSVLAIAVAAVLTGARSLAAIGEWAQDAPQAVLAALGVRHDPVRGTYRPPDEATVRRVLARLDADALDATLGRWLADQQPAPAHRSSRPARPVRALAIDGKTLRGSVGVGKRPVHLLAAMDHASQVVLAQVEVAGKTNEITRFAPLLDGLELHDTVITADAIHTQREHADWLVTVKHAAYVLVVKDHQPTLRRQLERLPWADIPVQDVTRDRAHGRSEIRRLQVATVAGLGFPHATRALRITRRVRRLGSRRWRTVMVYALTSLTHLQASPARLADYVRGHWASRRCTTSATSPSPRTPPRCAPARPQGHGVLAQPGGRDPAPAGSDQHRRRAAPQRPRRHPTAGPPWHHKLMNPTFPHFAETLVPDVLTALRSVLRACRFCAPLERDVAIDSSSP
jgi:predicted transposase YbfD/YdcC